MLGYLARTFPVLLRTAVGARGARVSTLTRRVRLGDIDLNRHMNQAVYAQVFELGRLDWLVRSGAWAALRAQGVNPVVAEQRIVYRRELGPWVRYAIDTRAVAVEGRLLVLRSAVIVGDRVHTQADVKLIFVGPRGVLSPDEAGALCASWLAPELTVHDWRVGGAPA